MFVHMTIGSDTYGRVKSINGVPVITKFGMFNFLPIFPIASFYYLGNLTQRSQGIPLLASSTTTTFSGLQLAKLDKLSVTLAYVRGFFATLAVVGFISIVPIIMYLTGEFLDAIAMTMLRVLLCCFAIGIVGGVCSYLVPTCSRREKEIRLHCERVLGIAIDPGQLQALDANEILAFVESQLGNKKNANDSLELALIRNRVTVANYGNSLQLEAEVDDLLSKLTC